MNPSEYYQWHEQKTDRCIKLMNRVGISDNLEYKSKIAGQSIDGLDEDELARIRNKPLLSRTRVYPYADQDISFVGTNPGISSTPDLLADNATEGVEQYSRACTEDWSGWLSNGSDAQVYHTVLQILSDESKLDLDKEIGSNSDVRGLINGDASTGIYEIAHFTNWFPLETPRKGGLKKFPEYREFATEVLKEETEIVNPSLICLSSTPAVRHNTVSDWTRLGDEDAYSNPPVERLGDRNGIGDVLGGIYASDVFPAPVAMFPHPSKLFNNYDWSVDGNGMKQRFREGLQAVNFS